MEKQELAALLKKLQTELESVQAVDDGLKQSLQSLGQDIQKVLAQNATPQAATTPSADEASLNERAQELEARFATEHPYLANTLRDVMDSLGKMGI
jgi:septal ring factor EnvC (AmiA/AmiB activator)